MDKSESPVYNDKKLLRTKTVIILHNSVADH